MHSYGGADPGRQEVRGSEGSCSHSEGKQPAFCFRVIPFLPGDEEENRLACRSISFGTDQHGSGQGGSSCSLFFFFFFHSFFNEASCLVTFETGKPY